MTDVTLLQCGIVEEVWDTVKISYLDVSDSSQVYELMKKSCQSRQGGRPFAEYKLNQYSWSLIIEGLMI